MSVYLTSVPDRAGAPDAVRRVTLPVGDAQRPDETWLDPEDLEAALDTVRETWEQTAKAVIADPSAGLAHMPACAGNASDFGIMLALSRLVQRWTGGDAVTEVICEDPWLFRHLATLPGVTAGAAPNLVWPLVRLAVRGWAARTRVAGRLLVARLRRRGDRRPTDRNLPALIVYGHPESRRDGSDAYFGDLMEWLPTMRRALHVDCGVAGAARLASERTYSLHAWGPLATILRLPFVKWRPSRERLRGPYAWLIRRAAAREGGTGQAAMVAWQIACQDAWLRDVAPPVVAWPWENHAWERQLVATARKLGVRTVGYQHSTISSREWNYAPGSNADPADSLPDVVLCSGPLTRDLLKDYGIANDRLKVGGALRAVAFGALPHAPNGPVFVALPFDQSIAAQIIDAIRPLGAKGLQFDVKAHPMTPYPFDESPGVTRCDTALSEHPGPSAVLYAATTVGLEAVIGGVPTLRFRPNGRIAADVVPPFLPVTDVTAGTIESALQSLPVPGRVDPTTVFAKPDRALWQSMLA